MPRSQWTFGIGGSGRSGAVAGGGLPVARMRGRYLLDHEALTCLLVLLFMDEPKLNTNRLHRVLRNLCYHGPTRAWIISALLSILQRTAEGHAEAEEPTAGTSSSTRITSATSLPLVSIDKCGKGKKGNQQQCLLQSSHEIGIVGVGWPRGDVSRCSGSWLSISLEAALGCRANVFQVHRSLGGKRHASSVPTGATVTIHPQAAPVVSRHVLDTLISLAKIFPSQFLPGPRAKEVAACDSKDVKDSDSVSTATSISTTGVRPKAQTATSGMTSPRISRSDRSSASSTPEVSRQDSDFWSLLVRLDSANSGRKGKGVQRVHGAAATVPPETELVSVDYNTSALGQLMTMLSHPVVRRSQLLTDRLLRLLGLISMGLQENANIGTVMGTSAAASNGPLTRPEASGSSASTITSAALAAGAAALLSSAASAAAQPCSQPEAPEDKIAAGKN